MPFKIGDKVRVVNYGHLVTMKEQYAKSMSFPIYKKEGKNWMMDMCPEAVGKKGTVESLLDGKYAINGIKEKHAWYDDGQLELI